MISGCTETEKKNSDLYTYYGLGGTYNQVNERTVLRIPDFEFAGSVYNPKRVCGTFNCNFPTQPSCTTDSTPTIYDKTFLPNGKGVFGFTGSSTFISTYYNNWLTTLSICWTTPSPTVVNYYRSIQLTVPSFSAPNNCTDNLTSTDRLKLELHPTSTVFTGTTISGGTTLYYMKITANTITNQFPQTFTNCDQNCEYYFNDYIVKTVNNFSTGTTQNFSPNPIASSTKTYSNGIYYRNPIYVNAISLNENDYQPTVEFESTYVSTTNIGNTYPFSGTPANDPSPSSYTIIPSLSGTVCNYNQTGQYLNLGTFQISTHYLWYYKVKLPNIDSDTDFEIWTTPIINYLLTPPEVLVYRYSGGTGTIINPAYII
jgi:hypothetical protein